MAGLLRRRTREGAAPLDAVGIASIAAFVLIWAAWMVGTRHAVTHALEPAAVGFLRFIIPAIFFAPSLWRSDVLRRASLPAIIVCVVGAGAPFFVVVSNGMRFAPAADVGPLLPGTMPLVVALASALFFGEIMGRLRWIGFALVTAGVAAIGGRSLFAAADQASIGHALFLCGAVMWASYTIGFRRSGMTAVEGVAVVSVCSAVMLAPFGVPSLIDAARNGHVQDILIQSLVQGVLSGIVALIAYNTAIARIGASRAAAFVALVPACVALLAIPVLGEVPDLAAWFGVVVTGLGVVLASGAISAADRQKPAG